MKSLNQRDREAESKLELRIKDLERQLRQVPSRWVQPLANYDLGFIGAGNGTGGGNNITPAGYTGIKKISTALTVIANYDLSTQPATVNGIGWGWHFRLNTFVLMLNDSRAGIGHDIPANAPVFLSPAPIVISNQNCYVIALT